MIWEASISPRLIPTYVRTIDKLTERKYHLAVEAPPLHVISYTPTTPPPILHVCRESHNVALKFQGGYKRIISKQCIAHVYKSIVDPVDLEPYVWVNFELDMVDVGTAPFKAFDCILGDGGRVRRLKLERPPSKKWRVDPCLEWDIVGQSEELREMCVCMSGQDISHRSLREEADLAESNRMLEDLYRPSMGAPRSVKWTRACSDECDFTDERMKVHFHLVSEKIEAEAANGSCS